MTRRAISTISSWAAVRLRPLFSALDGCDQIFNQGASKFHFKSFQFFFSGRGLVLFFLAAPGKLHHRVFCKIFTRHALPSPYREPGSFSGAN